MSQNPYESPLIHEAQHAISTNSVRPRRAFWPLWILLLLAFNLLSLPAVVQFEFEHPKREIDLPLARMTVVDLCSGVIEAQILLLAFWLSFGGQPRRWRSLLVFGIALCAGLVFSACVMAITWYKSITFSDEPGQVQIQTILFVVIPLIAVTLLWVINAAFVIPSWYFGFEINFPEAQPTSEKPSRTISFWQVFNWIVQVAIPFCLLNTVALAFESPQNVYLTLIGFCLVIACCVPLVLALLAPRVSIPFLFAAIGFTAIVTICTSLIGVNGIYPKSGWGYAVNALTVIINVLVLRWLGFRWTARSQPAAAVGHPHA